MNRLDLIGVVTAGALAVLLGVGVAGAGRLSVSSRAIEVTGSLRVRAGFVEGQCNVTLAGSFHAASFAKTSGSLIGHITRARAETCSAREFSSASMTFEALPWHLTYNSFAGTLPSITSVLRIMRAVRYLQTLVAFGGTTACKYEGNVGIIATMVGSRITGFTYQLPNAIRLIQALQEQLFPCPETEELNGTFGITSPTSLLLI